MKNRIQIDLENDIIQKVEKLAEQQQRSRKNMIETIIGDRVTKQKERAS